jgi:DNA polymerase-3 subunit gamma/tau
LRLIARAADRGVDLGQLGRSFLGFLRDLEVVASVKPAPGVELSDLMDATPEEIDEAKGLAERAAGGLVTVMFDRWARAVDEASRLPTPRLLYEMAAIDLCAAEPMLPLGDLLQRLDELEGRLRGGRPLVPTTPPKGGDRASGPSPAPAAPPKAGPRSWGAPSSSPAAQETAPPAPVAPARPADESPADTWRRVLAGFEAKRPRIAGLLAHAEVATLAPGAVTLAFPDKYTADQVEKVRGDVEAALSEALGQSTRVTFTVGASPAQSATAVRSEVGQQNDAAAADRRARENEARQHPRIRSAQDVFGAALKEIKT